MRLHLQLLLTCLTFCSITATKESSDNTMILSSTQNITIQSLTGQEARKYFDDIACIRLTLFSEYPYLYKGKVAYEQEYLETYFKSPHTAILLVFDGDAVIGFSSAIPLAEESDEMKEPFIKKGLNLNDYLYIGEVMVYPAYQGKGILRKFLEFHETKARKEGYKYTVFMTVERPDNHPYKPDNYKSLDAVWKHFGYELIPSLQVHLAWTQVDTNRETDNTLAFWQKSIYRTQIKSMTSEQK